MMKRQAQPLHPMNGSAAMIAGGIAALEALPDYLAALTAAALADGGEDECEVAEISIWENLPVTAQISDGLMFTHHGWTGEKWVPTTY